MSDTHSEECEQSYLSDVKNYAMTEEAHQNNEVLRSITPMPNSKGVLVVEVEKVLRDLQMLQKTLMHSKFYRMLVEDHHPTEELGQE